MLILKQFNKLIFTANLDRDGNTRFYFILEEVEETVFQFSQGNVKFFKSNIIKRFNFYQYKSDTIQQFKYKAIKFTA